MAEYTPHYCPRRGCKRMVKKGPKPHQSNVTVENGLWACSGMCGSIIRWEREAANLAENLGDNPYTAEFLDAVNDLYAAVDRIYRAKHDARMVCEEHGLTHRQFTNLLGPPNDRKPS